MEKNAEKKHGRGQSVDLPVAIASVLANERCALQRRRLSLFIQRVDILEEGLFFFLFLHMDRCKT